MGQNVSLPVYRGEIQARNLGMAVEAWDEAGTAPPPPGTGVRGDAGARGAGDAGERVLG